MELERCPRCGGEKTKDRRGPEYWIGRIEDCKYEPDKIFIYLGHLKKAIADANRRVPSRTEAEAVRLLMDELWRNTDIDEELFDVGKVRDFLKPLGLDAQTDRETDAAFRARYGEVET